MKEILMEYLNQYINLWKKYEKMCQSLYRMI